ncbi:MAG TPA: hypothetical protein VJZ93_04160 [Candidatus Nanoarchaeia archaeon]|nr:hypothetical protein [Candidatus Nanoarchaeia archaeon]
MPTPEPFKDDDEFFRYCRTHSETPRALFHRNHFNYLRELMGEKPVKGYEFLAIHEEEMNGILEIIERRKNSIEGVCEKIPCNVVRLEDYRR